MKIRLFHWGIVLVVWGAFSCSTQPVQPNGENSPVRAAGNKKTDFVTSGNKSKKGSSQLKLGTAALRDSEYFEALDHYQQSLNRFEKMNNKKGMVDALNGMGSTYREMGQILKAKQSGEQALTMSRSIRYLKGEAEALCILGRICGDHADYETALGYLDQALAIKRALHDPNWVGSILNNIGMMKYQLGQPREALPNFEKALELHRRTANRRLEALDLSEMGVAYWLLKEFDTAKNIHEQALAICREAHWPRQEALNLIYLGRDLEGLGRNEEALQDYEAAKSISQEIGYLRGQASALNNIGYVCLKLDRNEKALAAFEESLKISEDLGTPENVHRSQRGLGKTFYRMKRPDEAIGHYEQALDTIESIRANLSAGDARTQYMAGKLRVYDELIELLATLHRNYPSAGYDRKSLEIFERKQGRMILEEVGNSGAKNFSGLPERISDKEIELSENLDDLVTSLAYERTSPPYPHKLEVMRDLELQIRQNKADQQVLKEEIRTSFPDYYAIRYPIPATLPELQKTVLKPDEMILVYGVMEKFTCIWGIGKTDFVFTRIPVEEKMLSDQVQNLRAAILEVLNAIERHQPDFFVSKIARDSFSPIRENSRALADVLMPPGIRDAASKVKTLYIVPSGSLYFLPFEALVMTGSSHPRGFSYLIEENAVAYLSSASLLKSLREAMARRKSAAAYPLLAFANPVYSQQTERASPADTPADLAEDLPAAGDSEEVRGMRSRAYLDIMGGHFAELPETEEEASRIKAIMQAPDPSRPLQLRENASRSNVFRLNRENRLSEYQYLIFSCHGILPDQVDQVRQPALVLSNPDPETRQEGFLTMADVFQLKLNADLVTLSACNTGMGKVLRSEGIVGLTRAFMYAGTPAAVVNLWAVESRSAIRVTTGFYQNLKNGKSRAESLQAAKRLLISGEAGELFAHPFFWAPTIIFGEGS